MPERRGCLTVPEKVVEQLIKNKETIPFRGFLYANLQTRANILSPLVRSPNGLGMTIEEKTVIRKYARAAGQAAEENAEYDMGEWQTQQLIEEGFLIETEDGFEFIDKR